MKKIVTHPGTAHGDDFIACCILAATFDAQIERREPTQEELNDPKILVLDVGAHYEPEKLNFDHHQDLNIPCSLVLLLKHIGLNEKFSRAYKWYENVDFRDRRGMKALGEKYNLTDEQMLELESPVHTAMLNLFENSSILDNIIEFDGNTASPTQFQRTQLFGIMRLIGQELIDYAEKYGAAWSRLESCERQNFRGYEILINPSDDITATGDFARQHKISIMASHDNRGAGWAILRTSSGEKSFDFNKLASDPRITFAHKGGFIAKTKERLPVDQIFDLIGKAII